MSASAFCLVVGGALLHAYWNLQAKKARGGIAFIWLYGLVSLAVALASSAIFLDVSAVPLERPLVVAAIASAIVHVAYMWCLNRGYRSGDFSVVYPVARGVAPLMSVIGAVLWLRESPSPTGWLGAIAITAGIVAMGLHATSGGMRRPTNTREGVMWACLTGACISAYTLIDGWAVATMRLDPLAYYTLGLVIRSLLLAPIALRDPREIAATARSSWRPAVIVGALSPAAYLMILFAMQRASVSQVAPLREMSMLVGLFFGARALAERQTVPRLLGIASVVGGVMLVSLK